MEDNRKTIQRDHGVKFELNVNKNETDTVICIISVLILLSLFIRKNKYFLCSYTPLCIKRKNAITLSNHLHVLANLNMNVDI